MQRISPHAQRKQRKTVRGNRAAHRPHPSEPAGRAQSESQGLCGLCLPRGRIRKKEGVGLIGPPPFAMFFEKGTFSWPKTALFQKRSVRFTKRSGKAVKTGNAVLVFSTCFGKAVKIKDFICFKQQRSLSKNLNLSVSCIRNTASEFLEVSAFSLFRKPRAVKLRHRTTSQQGCGMYQK